MLQWWFGGPTKKICQFWHDGFEFIPKKAIDGLRVKGLKNTVCLFLLRSLIFPPCILTKNAEGISAFFCWCMIIDFTLSRKIL